jgi:UDP-2-acetamido-2-deoxy-ribo-hexuluronate aminotransferase
MKNFKYPSAKNFLVRARDLSIKNKKIKSNFNLVVNRICNHGIFILGHEVENFEKKISKFLSIKYAVAVSSGTSALYLALKCLKLKGDDEVITTPMSWLASSTAIKLAGGKPVFSDVDKNYNIDPDSIVKKINSKTKAILAVHFYGKVAQIDKIQKIAKENNLYLLEDVAQAFGTSLNGKKAGTFGDFGTFSFSPMKVFGSFGDAGIIVFNDKKYLKELEILRSTGTINKEICFTAENKHNIDPLQAAFICQNFNILEKLKKKRLDIAQRYYKKLNKNYCCPLIDKEYSHSFYDYTILVNNREKVIKHMYANGIEVKVRHPLLINDQPVFSYLTKQKLYNAENYVSKILSLPMHYNLTNKQINYVCEKLLEIC